MLTGSTNMVRVNLGVMAIEAYSTLTRSSKMEPWHPMQFNVLPRASVFEGVLPPGKVIRLSLRLTTGQVYYFFVHLNCLMDKRIKESQYPFHYILESCECCKKKKERERERKSEREKSPWNWKFILLVKSVLLIEWFWYNQ